MIRRTLDIGLSVLAIVILSLPMMAIAMIIKVTSPGPVFYRQTRVGRHERNFELLKFRSMKVQNNGPQVTADGDPRITAFGKFIRASKIDELPQLINVLKGEMSFVGPRPEVPQYVSFWSTAQKRIILSVRPGITDPVTVTLRNESEILSKQLNPEEYYINVLLPEKARQYVQYVQNRTLGGDLEVIFKTLIVVVRPAKSKSL